MSQEEKTIEQTNAESHINSEVYQAAIKILQQLQTEGKIRGNYYFTASKIAEFARKEVEELWV